MARNSESAPRRRRTLWTMLLSVLLLLVSTAVLLDRFAADLLKFTLTKAGADVRTLQAARRGLSGLEISRLNLNWPLGSTALAVELEGGRIFFSGGSLLPTLHVDALVVAPKPLESPEEQAEPGEAGAGIVVPPIASLVIERGTIKLGSERDIDFSVRVRRATRDSVRFSFAVHPQLSEFLRGSIALRGEGTFAEKHGIQLDLKVERSAGSEPGAKDDCKLHFETAALNDKVQLRESEGSDGWKLIVPALSISAPEVRCGTLSVHSTELEVRNIELQQTLSARIAPRDLKVVTEAVTVHQLPIAADVSLEGEEIKAKILPHESDDIALSGSVSYLPPEARGSATLALAPLKLSPGRPLHSVIEVAEAGFTLDAGSLGANASLRWNERGLEKASRITANLSKLGGTFQDITFSGATAKITLTGFPQWRTAEPTAVTIERLTYAVPLTNTSFKLSLKTTDADSSELLLEAFSTELFGGKVTSARIPVPRAGSSDQFQVAAEGIQLEKLLQLAGETVQGTGVLEIMMPVSMSDEGLRVKGGTVRALPPGGMLRYQGSTPGISGAGPSKGEAESNLNIALRALEQFNYRELSGDFDYAPDGELVARLSLLGKNPKLFDGREIRFNITLEENILKLLQSIRLATSAGKEVWDPKGEQQPSRATKGGGR